MTSYPIRRHHRLGPARSAAVVAASTTIAALLTNAAAKRWPRGTTPPAAKPAANGSADPSGAAGAQGVPPKNLAKRFLGGASCAPAAGTISALVAAAATIAWLRRPAGGKRHPLPFAVVDTETTGLDDAIDRVIELAVVYADGVGNVSDTFTWRTRPEDGRHGAEHVHHISEADLAAAPTFPAIAGDLAEKLRGRTLVAHNAPFDTRFLAGEYRRAGQRVPTALLRPLCTLELASRLGMAPLRLSEVARALGSPQPATAHRATDDAVATAQLLAPLLDRAGIARGDELPLVDGSVPRSWSQRRSGATDPHPVI